MITFDIQEFKRFLVSLIEDIREKPASPYYDGALLVLGKQLHFIQTAIQKGEALDMAKMKQEVEVTLAKMGDIPMRTRESYWPTKIKEEAEKLREAVEQWKRKKGEPKDKPVAMVKGENIRAGNLSAVVKKLRDQREIDADIKVLQRGDTIWLVKD